MVPTVPRTGVLAKRPKSNKPDAPTVVHLLRKSSCNPSTNPPLFCARSYSYDNSFFESAVINKDQPNYRNMYLHNPILQALLVDCINPLKHSGVRWLHFEVFSAIQV